MNYSRKFLFIICLFLFVAIPAFSQVKPVENPVTWSYSQSKIGDKEYNLVFTAKIKVPWHIYTQFLPTDAVGPVPTSFTFNNSPAFQLVGKTVEKGNPISVYDSNFEMKLTFYEKQVIFIQRIKTNGHADKVTGSLEYMTCDNKGCLKPDPIDFVFQLGESPDTKSSGIQQGNDSAGKQTVVASADDKGKPVAKGNETSGDPAKKGLWAFILFALGQGLLSLITPCVFPMIPMTVSFFTHSEKKRIKGIFNAMTFGISIILVYMVLGILFGLLFGEDSTHEFATHWLPNLFFFAIFVIFAASFFGMFEIVLPAGLINKVEGRADKGGFLGPFFMAFTTVLVSFSCTMPLVAMVVALAKGGDIFKSVIGMFAYSFAFATPFTLFAIFPKWLSSLPKSGGWLNTVKVFLGFIELAFGLKFLSVADQAYHWHILDREVYLAIWIVIFALLGFYLLGKLKFSHDSDLPHLGVPRLILAIVVLSFVVYLIPGMFGAPLTAISGYLPPQQTQTFDLYSAYKSGGTKQAEDLAAAGLCDKPKYSDFLHFPHGIKGYFDYEQAKKCAVSQHKPLFIDFTGLACVNCRNMEAKVWSDPRVLKLLKNDFVVVSLYVDDKTELPEDEWVKSAYDGKWKKSLGKKNADIEVSKYNYNVQPFYVIIDENEKQLTQPRAFDLNTEAYLAWLQDGLNKYRENQAGKKD